MNNVGKLFILVEGEVDDAKYLSVFLKDIFNLSIVTDSSRDLFLSARATQDLQVLTRAQAGDIIIIKASPKPQLHAALNTFDDYTNIPSYYGIIDSHLFNTAIIFDKDILSGNTNQRISMFLQRYDDILDLGLLLVSYPCLESLMISCKDPIVEYFTDSKEAKRTWKSRTDKQINQADLNVGIQHMLANLAAKGYSTNIDDIVNKRDDIDKEIENDYLSQNRWLKLSLVSLMFLVLGLI